VCVRARGCVSPPYCDLYFFRHYLIKGIIFGKKLLNVKCFDFLYSFYLKHFFILRRINRDRHKFENVFKWSTHYSCRILIKLAFFLQIFEKKSLIIKFHQNPSSGSRIVPCGRTDGHEEGNSCSSQFCKRAYKQMVSFLKHVFLQALKQ
jgi:hypothetical protein